MFDYHSWAQHFAFWPSFVKYTCIELTDTETVAIKRGFQPLLRDLRLKADSNLRTSAKFFRLSTRSPKDVWSKLDQTLGRDAEDDIHDVTFKLQSQIQLCRVSNFNDVLRLIACSDRLQEDIDLHIEKANIDHRLSIVLIDWRDLDPTKEVRIFIKERKVIAYCPYLPDQCSEPTKRRLTEAKMQIDMFCAEVCKRLPKAYQSFVLDVSFVNGRFEMIELNPFDDTTDPIIFNWNWLKYTA